MFDNGSHHSPSNPAEATSSGLYTDASPLSMSPRAERMWLTDPGDAHPVLDMLRGAGWGIASDSSANVYTSSPDNCAFIRFTPEHPGGRRGPLWEVTVDDHRGYDWTQTFDSSTPNELVHAFVTTLLTAQRATESV
ncbi:DUF317 domain-containing protein [Embleya sp. NPDC059237]|uniref:DUF317 domain-containing protein n=1 Tax=unclassified Embleya TaxID=2699296 RepID=UPI0036B76B1F